MPRTGFERDKECDLVTTLGNFYQTNDQISCGGHTQRFAYYVSANGNRSEYGLQTPVAQVFHDAENGYGGFASFIFNPDPKNQFRLVASLREDYYQIPYDPDPNSFGNQAFPVMASVMASTSPRLRCLFMGSHIQPQFFAYGFSLLSLQQRRLPSPERFSCRLKRNSDRQLRGLQASLNANLWRNDIQVGVYGFGQHQYNFFSNLFTDGSLGQLPPLFGAATGGLASFLSTISSR